MTPKIPNLIQVSFNPSNTGFQKLIDDGAVTVENFTMPTFRELPPQHVGLALEFENFTGANEWDLTRSRSTSAYLVSGSDRARYIELTARQNGRYDTVIKNKHDRAIVVLSDSIDQVKPFLENFFKGVEVKLKLAKGEDVLNTRIDAALRGDNTPHLSEAKVRLALAISRCESLSDFMQECVRSRHHSLRRSELPNVILANLEIELKELSNRLRYLSESFHIIMGNLADSVDGSEKDISAACIELNSLVNTLKKVKR